MPRTSFRRKSATRFLPLIATATMVAGLGLTSFALPANAQQAVTAPSTAPVSAVPAPMAVAPVATAAPMAELNPLLLIYRAAPEPFGERDTVSALVCGDHSGATVHLRLIASGGAAAAVSSTIRGSDGDAEPLWPQWISPAITLDFRGWKKIDFPASSFTYRPPAGQSAADAPKLSSVDAFGVDMDDKGETLLLDNLTWLSSAGGAQPVVVDDFETGDYAAWQTHGTPETIQDAQLALMTQAAKAGAGRVSFSISFAAAKQACLQSLALLKRTLATSDLGYATYVPASPFRRILPDSTPRLGETSQAVQLFACPDQTESGSFCIYSDSGLSDVTITPRTGLQEVGHSIDASNIDVRVVKVWTREGIGKYRDPDAAGPTPELLMKDDREPLSVVSGQAPRVRLTGDPTTSIPAHTTKQFWITVHIPKDAIAGHYTSQLAITGPSVKPSSVTLSVEVLPLHLYSASKQYVMGFDSHIAVDGVPSAPSATTVDKDTFAAELDDIRAHGFLYATLTDAPGSLWDAYSVYKTSTLGTPLMYAGLTGSAADDMAACGAIQSQIKSEGVAGVDYIAPESVSPAELAAMHKKFWTTAAFVRTQDEFDSEQSVLDMPIYSVDEPYVQQLLKTDGLRTSEEYDYWYWPAYENDPQANRLYAGFLLYRANLYGAYVPDYQHSLQSDPYADEPDASATGDAARLRPAMLTYPVQGGVLDTIQFEALLAEVNDMRYLTTYFAALRECKDNHVAKDDVAVFEPQVKAMMDKAFWVMDDTEYQKARRVIAHDTVILRKSLNTFYAHGGGNPLSANGSESLRHKKADSSANKAG